MNSREATELGERLAVTVQEGLMAEACDLLAPVLAERTPFPMLRRIGRPIGTGPLEPANAFLARIAVEGTMGGWVVIASVLERQLDRDLAGALARCRAFIIAADVWYAADIMGEGVAGQALVRHFPTALDLLGPWREDSNAWVRRSAGTAVHFWAKRSRGTGARAPEAEELLDFLEPMFEEWDLTAVKGVGWGLKTLGRCYPDQVASWLAEQVVRKRRRHRTLMLRKATTHLSEEQLGLAVDEVLRSLDDLA